MNRNHVQLPEPLFLKLQAIATSHDWSLAEVVRRGMESYVQTFPEVSEVPYPLPKAWQMPVLRGSGGQLRDPATVSIEADSITERSL
jgi:hypothetical protein